MMWLNFEMTSSRISANGGRWQDFPKNRGNFYFFLEARENKQLAQLARHCQAPNSSIGDDGDGHRDDDAVPPDWGG